jgi:hypothetical protein
MKILKKIFGSSWRTGLLGFLCVLWGFWLAKILWVHGQTLYFNLVYVMSNPILFVLVGVGLMHARDNKVSSEDAGIKKD